MSLNMPPLGKINVPPQFPSFGDLPACLTGTLWEFIAYLEKNEIDVIANI